MSLEIRDPHKMPTCEVCNKNETIGVASLPFAAYSAAFCRECLRQNAYPMWTMMYLFIDVGNKDDSNLIPECKEFKSFWKGEYVDWEKCKSVALEFEKVKDDMSLEMFERA